MGCQGNHAVLHNHNGFSFKDKICLHLSGPIKQFDNDKKLLYGVIVGLVTPYGTSLSNFPSCFEFPLVFINMQMRSFSYRISGRKELSNCAT